MFYDISLKHMVSSMVIYLNELPKDRFDLDFRGCIRYCNNLNMYTVGLPLSFIYFKISRNRNFVKTFHDRTLIGKTLLKVCNA